MQRESHLAPSVWGCERRHLVHANLATRVAPSWRSRGAMKKFIQVRGRRSNWQLGRFFCWWCAEVRGHNLPVFTQQWCVGVRLNCVDKLNERLEHYPGVNVLHLQSLTTRQHFCISSSELLRCKTEIAEIETKSLSKVQNLKDGRTNQCSPRRKEGAELRSGSTSNKKNVTWLFSL